MSDELFHHPEVLKVIRAVLVSKGVRPQELEDVTRDVVLTCIEESQTKGPPKDLKAAISRARVKANDVGNNLAKQRNRRAKTNVGTTGDADEHGLPEQRSVDPVDQGRYVGIIRGAVGDDQVEVLIDSSQGVSSAELGAERGISDATMRKRKESSRKKAIRALKDNKYWVSGGFVGLLGVMFVVFAVRRGWQANDHNVAAVAPDDGHPTAAEMRIAKEQRHIAFGACEEKKWDECERALDEAAKVDPVGDRNYVAVVAMRDAIAAGRAEAGVGAGDGGTGRAGASDAASPTR